MGKNIQDQEKNQQQHNVNSKEQQKDSIKTGSNVAPRKGSVNNGKPKEKKPTKK